MAGRATLTMAAGGAFTNSVSREMNEESETNPQTHGQNWSKSKRALLDFEDPDSLENAHRSQRENDFWDSLKVVIDKNVKSNEKEAEGINKVKTLFKKLGARRRASQKAAAEQQQTPSPIASSTTPKGQRMTDIKEAPNEGEAPSTPHGDNSPTKKRSFGPLSNAKVYMEKAAHNVVQAGGSGKNILSHTINLGHGPHLPKDEYEEAAKKNAHNMDDYLENARNSRVSNPFLEKVRAKAALAKKRQQAKHAKAINPKSPRKIYWDLLCGLFIIYSVVVTPWRISFEQDTIYPDFAFFLELFIDVTFLVDMIISFFTGFYTPEGRFIADRKIIGIRYLKSWFTVDFLSTFPFDRVLPLLAPDFFTDESSLRMIKLIRTLRLFRLLKLLRLLKLSSKLGNTGGRDISEIIPPAMIRLIKLLFKIMFIAHLLACFWFLSNECIAISDPSISEEDEAVWEDCGSHTLTSQYIASFYWTIATMMAVGYGDISAETNSERFYAIITQVVGAVAFGFIIATVTIIIETVDPEATAKKLRKDELRDYLNERRYSKDLQKRAKQHFNYHQSRMSTFPEMYIVEELSHTLKEVVLYESRNDIISAIKMFRAHVSDQFITDCVLRLKPMLMSYHQGFGNPGDISEEVYFVTKGRIEGLHLVEQKLENMEDDLKEEKSGAEDDKVYDAVLATITSDGYELELTNCLHEKPMDLRYRAASVTDVLWLDHESLIHLTNCYHRSAASVHQRAFKYEKMLNIVLSSEVKNLTEGLFMHNKILKNDQLVRYSDVKEGVLKSLRPGGAKSFGDRKRRETSAKGKKIQKEMSLARRLSMKAVGGSSTNLTIDDEEEETLLLRTWIWDPVAQELVEKEETEYDLLSRRLINPNSGTKLKWDIFVGLLIIVSVILVPFRLGFDIETTVSWDSYDWATDFFFLLDIFINFRTCFLDDHQVLHTSTSIISEHYLRGWFTIDFLSTVPLDRLMVSLLPSSTGLRGLKMIRIVRLVRLAKLIKLLKQQSENSSEDVIPVDATVQKVLKLLATLFFIGHLFGCFFSYITLENVAEYGDVINMTHFGIDGNGEYEIPYNSDIPYNGASSWWVKINVDGDDIGSRYLAALYWAFTTMTTVGYGDVTPATDGERIYASLIMIMGATVFGYIVGSVSGLASNPHGAVARENERISTLANYLEEQNIKPALRRMAREQLTFNRSFISVFDEARILSGFPINIRREMILETHADTIEKISLFSDDVSLITNVLHYLKPKYFSAGQFIYRTSDEGVKGIMFLLDGIAEEVPDEDWVDISKRDRGGNNNAPIIGKLYSQGKLSIKKNKNNKDDEDDEAEKRASEKKEQGKGLHRNIIEAGKCFGYQCFVTKDKDRKPMAYRAFSDCSLMVLSEVALRSIIERHPVLRDKLRESLRKSIIRQTASDDVLSKQVHKLQKKNSLFHALQTNLMKGVKTGSLARALEKDATVQQIEIEDDQTGKKKAAEGGPTVGGPPVVKKAEAADLVLKVEEFDH
ncbi:hypothetical protein TrST_g13891 [Triparma strigata]|uniref:Ion transport domain-containing protein n=1 Tax=Triparma strigata TaxID=1606541 RepID=A0A9W7B9Z3_9STRA|nr:hypothetical protein TrST_g13891 [Triparma strigata]